jgi:hypothetical protein
MNKMILLLIFIVSTQLWGGPKNTIYLPKTGPVNTFDSTAPCMAWYQNLNGARVNSESLVWGGLVSCQSDKISWAKKNAKLVLCSNTQKQEYTYKYQWPNSNQQKIEFYKCTGLCSDDSDVVCLEDK